MTPEQFAYWMQGFVELQNSNEPPTEEQWQIIKDHLQLVFKKVTPQRNCSVSNETYCGLNINPNLLSYTPDGYYNKHIDLSIIPHSC